MAVRRPVIDSGVGKTTAGRATTTTTQAAPTVTTQTNGGGYDWQNYQNAMQVKKNEAAQSGNKADYDKYNQELYRVSSRTGINPTVAKTVFGSAPAQTQQGSPNAGARGPNPSVTPPGANQQPAQDPMQYGTDPALLALIEELSRGQQSQFDAQQQAQLEAQNRTDALFKQFQDAMAALNNQNSQYWDQQKQVAAEQAKKLYDEKKSGFEGLIGNLKANQNTELSRLQNTVTEGEQTIEDKSFQNWLESRQGIANRGLAGSGLQQDADTRLMLGRQDDLANLYRQTATDMQDINNRYGTQLNDAQRQLSGLSQTDLESGLFRDLYKTGNENLTGQAKMYSDLLSKIIGYDYASVGDVLNYNSDRIDTQFKYDELKTKYNFDYTKLGSEEKRFFTELQAKDQQFYAKLKQDGYLDLTKVMGVDPTTGRPTLDMLKLSETIRSNLTKEQESSRHNLVSESIAGMNAQTSAINAQTAIGRLNETIANNTSKLQMDVMKLENTQWATQGKQLNDIINAKKTRITQLTSAINAGIKAKQDVSSLQNELKTVTKDYDASVIALEKLSGVSGSGSASTPGSTTPSNPAGNSRGNLQ